MIPWFQYTTISIGPIPVQVWGFFVAMGMLLAVWIISKRAKRNGMKVEPLLDLAVKMIIWGVVFARVFHIVFYEPAYFLAHPVDVIKIWHGGLSSFGGLFGAVIPLFFYHKRNKELFWKVVDLFSYSALFGWMVGRVGCVMIHDHLGAPCDCMLAIQSPDGPRLDMALLEILALIPLAIVFFVNRKKSKPHGWWASVLLIYYGVVRFILDFWRADPRFVTGDARYLGLTPGQYFAIVLIVLGVWIFSRNLPSRRIQRA